MQVNFQACQINSPKLRGAGSAELLLGSLFRPFALLKVLANTDLAGKSPSLALRLVTQPVTERRPSTHFTGPVSFSFPFSKLADVPQRH